MNIDIKKKNVHNNTCFEDINEHVLATISLLDILSDMEDVAAMIEEYVVAVAGTYKIDQIDIMADARNNKYSVVKNGTFIIDVYYKHINCYNVTQITYTITR